MQPILTALTSEAISDLLVCVLNQTQASLAYEDGQIFAYYILTKKLKQ